MRRHDNRIVYSPPASERVITAAPIRCAVISRCCAGMRLRTATRAHDLHFARFVTAPAILYG